MTTGLPESTTTPAGRNAPHTQKSWRAHNGLPHRDSKDIAACYACHAKLPAGRDFVFTDYSK